MTAGGPDGPVRGTGPGARGGGRTQLTLLSRAYCHLCDEMLAAVAPLAAARGVAVAVLDVDAPENAHLEPAWGDLVPVLFAGPPASANELCHYHLDPERVEAALAAGGADPVAPASKIR